MTRELFFLHHGPDSEHINHGSCCLHCALNQALCWQWVTVKVPLQSPKERLQFFFFFGLTTVTRTSRGANIFHMLLYELTSSFFFFFLHPTWVVLLIISPKCLFSDNLQVFSLKHLALGLAVRPLTLYRLKFAGANCFCRKMQE